MVVDGIDVKETMNDKRWSQIQEIKAQGKVKMSQAAHWHAYSNMGVYYDHYLISNGHVLSKYGI